MGLSMSSPPVSSPFALLRRTVADTPRFWVGVALAAVANLTEGLGIFLLVPILSVLAGPGSAPPGLSAWLPDVPLAGLVGLIIALVAVRLVARRAALVEQYRVEWAMIDQLRHDIYSGLHRANWRWLSAQRGADLVDMLVSQMGRIAMALREALGLFSTLTGVAVYSVAAIFLSWQTAAVAAVFGCALTLVARRQRKRALAHGHAFGALTRDVHRRLQEGVAALRMNRIVGAEAVDIDGLGDAVVKLRGAQMQNVRDRSLSFEIGQMTSALLIAALIAFAVGVAEVPIATLLPFLLVILRLAPMIERVEANWQNWLQAAPALDEALALRRVLRAEAEPEAPADGARMMLTAALRLTDIHVHYAGREARALNGIDLTLRANTTTLIAGPSGAGKSTLADVLTGLLVPDLGTIEVDGVAISGADRLRWRRSVAYVEQHATLGNGTIRNNLCLVAPDASDDALCAALHAASADFVLALPAGLDTEVGDNGLRLSGGERQRIALARALLVEPQLLILDEATNALDRANEMAIKDALAALRGKRTIVVISHSSALAGAVDCVVHIETGRVVTAPGL